MMIQEDEKEKFELLRDMAEHNAAFQNSEGVKQVRDMRENAISVPDDDFRDTVKELFGRDISLSKEEEEAKRKALPNIYNEIDEVKFVPFGE